MALPGKRYFKAFRVDRRILLGFLAVAGAAWAFLKFASEVMEGETLAFDRWILLALRRPGDLATPVGPHWLRLAMSDITALGGFTVLTIITVCAACYLLAIRKIRTAAILAVSVASGMFLSSLLKDSFQRVRPDVVPHLVQVQTASFPSGHAMHSAVAYLTLGVLLADAEKSRGVRIYLMAVAIVLTLLIGVSRVYLGVHWPSDVIAGWCLGAAWAMLCSYAARALQKR
ncbi:MAG: phosphatase PAP2 family protein [Sphingomonadales bacterium]|nr:phosphatase PAP2 family protein [Sphingomonadales bacterium]